MPQRNLIKMEYWLDDHGFVVVETDRWVLAEMNGVYQMQYAKSNLLNSHTVHDNSLSRKAGVLGELVFSDLYGTAKQSTDMRWDFWFKGRRVDVKCKYRNFPPNKENNEASLFAYQVHNAKIEYYYFMSTVPNFERVWLCGYISRRELLEHPMREFWKKGAIDTSNGKEFKADTLSIGYGYLHPVDIEKITPRQY